MPSLPFRRSSAVPPPTADTPWLRLKRGWERLPLAVAVLVTVVPILVTMWALLLQEMSQRQTDIRREHEQRIYNVTQISAQALNGLLIAVDQTLLEIREDWVEHPERFSAMVEQRRRSSLSSLGMDIHISIIGADGRVRYSSLNPNAAGMDASQAQHFTRPRDTLVDRIFVSPPFNTAVAKRLLMPFSRRLLPDRNGNFAGVIVFWISPDFVTSIYKTTRFNPRSTFTLVELNNGQILLRHIKPEDADTQLAPLATVDPAKLRSAHPVSAEYLNALSIARARQLPSNGVGRWHSLLDQVERTYGWHKFSNVPFALIAGEPTEFVEKVLARQRWRYLGTGGIVSLLLILAIAGTLALLRTRARAASRQTRQLIAMADKQAQLEQSREQLRRLGQHLASARENERQRIAQDLHDELGQRLSVMRMSAALIAQQLPTAPAEQQPAGQDMAGLAPAVHTLKAQIDDTIAVVRQIAEDLRPGALSVGLAPAVESLCDQFKDVLGMNCLTRIQLPPGATLSMEAATVAYRIVQESLTNVARHAQATEFEVQVDAHDGWLHLSVSDNGTGFKPGEHDANTFGLIGMEERARAIGGDISLHSVAGLGTRIKARLPVQPLHPDTQHEAAVCAADPLPT